MSARTRKSLVLFWTALFVFSLALQYANFVVAPARVDAASGLKAGTVQGFEVDGDLASGNGASNPGGIPAGLIDGTLTNGDDWLDGASGNGVVDPATPPTSFIVEDLIDSTSDDGFIGGAKETDTRTWGYTLHKATPKDDIHYAMTYAKFVGSSAFFYAGATRIVNNGDTHIDFELNRNPFKVYSDGIAKPDRTIGDVLVSLEFSNGGSDPIVTVYKVTAVANFPTGQDTTFSADVATAAAVHSATNFVALADQGLGAIPQFQFAETSIDLSALGIETGCPGLSNGHIRTRAGGDLDSSQLKDNIPPFPIDLNNCGKLRIEKRDASGALLPGATFEISDDPRPGMTGLLTVTDGGANDPDATANGIIEFDPAEPGTYTVTETIAPAGYIKDPTPQTKTLDPNGSVTFVFTNNLGSIRWLKHGPDGTSLLGGATFSVTPNPLTGTGSLTVADNGSNDDDPTAGEFQVNNARVGTYEVCETAAPSGYILDPDCANVSVSAGTPNGVIASGTFVNTLGSIAWQKEDEDGGLLGGATFSVTPNPLTGTGSLTIVDDDANDADATDGKFKIENARVGTYTVCETVPPAGYIGDPDCAEVSVSAGAPNGTIAAGTFINRLGSIAWQKYDEDGQLLAGATFTIQLLPGGPLTTVVDNGANDDDPDGGEFLVDDLPTGTYEVCETVAPPGYVLDGDCKQGTIDDEHEDVDLGAFINGLGSVSWVKHDGDGQLLGGATFEVTLLPDGDPITVVDNGANDDDPDAGEFLVGDLPLGTYRICETEAPAGYVMDETCQDVTLTQGSPDGSAAEPFVNTLGSVSWVKHDGEGQLLGGATFRVTGPFDFDLTVTDNDTNDADPTLGEFKLDDLKLGSYEICETAAPAGYVMDEDCQTVVIDQEDPHGSAAEPFVNTLGSVSWVKTKGDENETRLGGAVFEVSPNPYGAGDLTVADNDPNDADPDDGEFKLVDVPVGTYTITELEAPEGYEMDEDSCVVTVDAENPAGDTVCEFQNPPIPPDIDVVKTAGPSLASQVADGLTYFTEAFSNNTVYKYVVTNTGDVRLIDVELWDDNGTPGAPGDDFLVCSFESIDPGDSETCSVTASITADTTNIVVASGKSVGEQTEVTDTDDAVVEVVGAAIEIIKTAGDAEDGEVYVTEAFPNNVTYTYKITNTGEVDLFDVEVVDDNGTPGNTADDHDVCTIEELPVGASETCTLTLTVEEDTVNVAVATGHTEQQPDDDVSDDDDAAVEIVAPDIEIIKTAGDAEDGEVYVTEAFPNNVTYTYKITNTGEVDLFDVEVVDDNGTPGNTADDHDVCTIEELPVGASETCTLTLTVEEDTVNVAVATGHTEQQPDEDVTDDDDAVVRVPDTGIDKSNNDADGVVGHGQEVTYTILVEVVQGPVTNAVVTDTLPAGQTYVASSQTSNPAAATFNVSGDGRTLTWTYASLPSGDPALTITYKVTIDANAPTGNQTNIAEICVSELEDCKTDDTTVRVPLLTIVKSFVGNTGGTAPNGAPEARIGDVLTYTLAYDLTNGPVTNGVITDTLPVGLAYVAGSATSNAEFTFQSFNAATRTLTWTAPTVTADGTVTYRAAVLTGSDELPQPLVNVATIDSDETDEDDDTKQVFVEPPPLAETATPTLPPTDSLYTSSPGSSNPGYSLMLLLLAIAGFALVIGFITPVPERVRRRGRLG